MLSDKSIMRFDPARSSDVETGTAAWLLYYEAHAGILAGYPLHPGYSSDHFLRRLGDPRARYVNVRFDHVICTVTRIPEV
jgi:hypothetical protein